MFKSESHETFISTKWIKYKEVNSCVSHVASKSDAAKKKTLNKMFSCEIIFQTKMFKKLHGSTLVKTVYLFFTFSSRIPCVCLIKMFIFSNQADQWWDFSTETTFWFQIAEHLWVLKHRCSEIKVVNFSNFQRKGRGAGFSWREQHLSNISKIKFY